AALLVGMLHIAGPGAVIFVFAATGAMGFAQDANDVARALVATTLGAICGAVASLAPWLLRNSWQMVR
ncbi:FUSC family protein, partial [Streptomyces sp. SID10244]|nr:FUSC family protein [Streptomyces sp. SID10244]